MASTITSGTLTVKLTEKIVLDGSNLGSESTLSITGISNVSKRIATISTTEATLLTFSSAVGQGKYIAANVRYLRFKNLDDTNFIVLTFKDEGNTEFKVKVDAGQSYIYNADASGGLADTMKASGSALGSGLADLFDVTADADTASCALEIFVASV